MGLEIFFPMSLFLYSWQIPWIHEICLLLLCPCLVWMTRYWMGHFGLNQKSKITHKRFCYKCHCYWLIIDYLIMLLSRWFCWAASSLNVGVQCFWHVSIFCSKSKIKNTVFCKEWAFLTFIVGGPRGALQKLPVSKASFSWFSCTSHGTETSARGLGLSDSFFQQIFIAAY